MLMPQSWTVIGIFENQDYAKQAIDELHQAGFSENQVGFVFREGVPIVSKVDTEPEESTQAFVGGVPGAADALLTPVPGPAVASTISTATMPVVEQSTDRFQHAGTGDELNYDGVNGHRGQQQNAMAASTGEMSAREEIVADEETPTSKLAPLTGETPGENGVVAVDEMPTTKLTPITGEAADEDQIVAADEKRMSADEATGVVTGGIVGGLLGAAVALLIPVFGPVFAGGILVTIFSTALGAVTGAFIRMGIPEEDAHQYEQEFKAGRTIVTVNTDDRQQRVLDILYHNNSSYINAHERE